VLKTTGSKDTKAHVMNNNTSCTLFTGTSINLKSYSTYADDKICKIGTWNVGGLRANIFE